MIQRENLKIIISGSARLEINADKETLAGRMLIFYLPVLTFKEYARYFKMKYNISIDDNVMREYDLEFASEKERYIELFNQYIIKGAFPELLEAPLTERECIQRYVKESVIEKSIIDIARLTREDERAIYELFRLLANSNAILFEIINISNILKKL